MTAAPDIVINEGKPATPAPSPGEDYPALLDEKLAACEAAQAEGRWEAAGLDAADLAELRRLSMTKGPPAPVPVFPPAPLPRPVPGLLPVPVAMLAPPDGHDEESIEFGMLVEFWQFFTAVVKRGDPDEVFALSGFAAHAGLMSCLDDVEGARVDVRYGPDGKVVACRGDVYIKCEACREAEAGSA